MGKHFIADIVEADLASGKHARIQTRFPPEPNGYLHLGHAKSICLNFGLAAEYGGLANLRFDDTNPTTEEDEYVRAIREDVRWLGFDWGEREFYASDYFEQLFDWARAAHSSRARRSSTTLRPRRSAPTAASGRRPARRARTGTAASTENLDLFRRMRAGEFPDGARVLRAKIDMASGNINLRDPVMYRILHATPPPHRRHVVHLPDVRLGARPVGLDRADHPLDLHPGVRGPPPALRLVRRRARHLRAAPDRVRAPERDAHGALEAEAPAAGQDKVVSGWDDPRMPTLAGIRRRGYPPAALRDFCERIGVTKQESVVDFALLEHCVREELNRTAERRMAVLDPVRVTLVDYPEGEVDELEAVNNPEDPAAGTRRVPFSRELWIDREDFLEEPPKKFFRLAPGREVRLRWAYIIRCEEVVKDATGKIVELKCTHDPLSRGGDRGGRSQDPGHDPLGLGAARGRRRGAASTTTSSPRPIRTTSRRAPTSSRW